MDIAILDHSRVDPDRVPDLSAAWPGDLILVSPQPAPYKSRLIMTGQTAKLQHTWVNAGWTHAAIYTGRGYQIVEATPKSNIAQADLMNYVPDHLIRFRRVCGITREQGQ